MAEIYTTAKPPAAKAANRRLLPHVVDEIAASEPEAPWAEIPAAPTSYDAGYHVITWKALANAVNGLAGLLETQLGRGSDFEALCYMGPSDPRYPMMILASIKAGYKAFLDSPRNSIAAHSKLFEELKCRTIVTSFPPPPFVAPLQKAFPGMKVIHIPSIDDLISTTHPHYAYNKTFEEAKHEPMFCIHTSGSTGLPKPIVFPHEYMTVSVNISQLPPPEGYNSLNNLIAANRCILFLPLFHMAGIYVSLFMSIMNRNTIVFPLSNAPPTGASLGAMTQHVKADWALLAPMHAEEVAKDPQLLDAVSSSLEMLFYTGGNLPVEVGEKLSSRILLFTLLGSTEFGAFPHLSPKWAAQKDNWAYVHLHPHILPEFQDCGEGYAELVIRRDDKHKLWQTPFVLFPQLTEYRTKDIFKPHQSLPDTWLHQGRNDDMIVFLNGEKLYPKMFEETVNKHPKVRSSLVFGNQRTEAGILVELQSANDLTPVAEQALKNSIYVKIEEANAATPAHARISKTHILFTAPDKPFSRASKGTIQRQATMESYNSEIRNLYKSIEAGVEAPTRINAPVDGAISDDTSLEDVILTAVQSVTKLSIDGHDTDFFSAGLDSLQSLRLARQLRKQLKRPDIEPGLIYAHPSIQSLARYINRGGRDTETSSAISLDPVQSTFQEQFSYMEILAACINTANPNHIGNGIANEHITILLTGSTGFLGSHLVNCLLADPKVSHVYCLNRRVTHTSKSSSRVTNLIADLANPINFGLSPQDYQKITCSVTHIIHAAWPVDFAQPLSRFRQSLASTTNLLLFAARALYRPAFLYISSISAVMNMKNANEVVPSSLLNRTNISEMGYGQSKLVAEQIVNRAAEHFRIRAGIVRVGQIAGPRAASGVWNLREWFPRLIRTSKQMQMIPQSLGQVADALDWIPVDQLAQILSELVIDVSTKPHDKRATVFNVVNTNRGAWSEMIGTVQKALGGAKTVDGQEWLQTLRGLEDSVDQDTKGSGYDQLFQKYPSLPLEKFYHNLFSDKYPLVMDTRTTEQASSTMRNLQAIDSQLVGKWVQGIIG